MNIFAVDPTFPSAPSHLPDARTLPLTEHERRVLAASPLTVTSTLAEAATLWLRAQVPVVSKARATRLVQQLEMLADITRGIVLADLTEELYARISEDVLQGALDMSHAVLLGKTMNMVLDFAERAGAIPVVARSGWLQTLAPAPAVRHRQGGAQQMPPEQLLLLTAEEWVMGTFPPLDEDSSLSDATALWLRTQDGLVSGEELTLLERDCSKLTDDREVFSLVDLTPDCISALLDDVFWMGEVEDAFTVRSIIVEVLAFAAQLNAISAVDVPLWPSRPGAAS
jgi:hypothetical protein